MKPEGGFGGAAFTPPSAPLTRAIVVACIAVEAVATLTGFGAALDRHAALVPARLMGIVPSLPGDVPGALTLVTALFLHAGWVHLFVNLAFLLWVGRHVEIVAGRAAFVGLYFLSGIAGGLLQVAVAPASTVPVIGASGAIAGVFGAYAVLFGRSRVRARRLGPVTVPAGLVSATWYAATWIGLQLLTGIAFNSGGGVGGSSDWAGGIAIWTHIGGFVTGLIGAQFVRRRW